MKNNKTGTPLYKKLLIGVMLVLFAGFIAACSEMEEASTDVKADPAEETAVEDEKAVAKEPVVKEEEEPVEKEPVVEEPAEPKVSAEFSSALKQAENYSDMMHMSKLAIFDQLTSEHGGQFPDEAAQYAIDNLDVDWNENALASAISYQETMSMSKEAIRDQLTSEYGGQFTVEEAAYAVENLE